MTLLEKGCAQNKSDSSLQHFFSKLQKLLHCKFKYKRPRFNKRALKEHGEFNIDTYPHPSICSNTYPWFLIRSGNAKISQQRVATFFLIIIMVLQSQGYLAVHFQDEVSHSHLQIKILVQADFPFSHHISWELSKHK